MKSEPKPKAKKPIVERETKKPAVKKVATEKKPAKAETKPKAAPKPKPKPKTGNPVGRPTSYKPEFCQALMDYVEANTRDAWRENTTATGQVQILPVKPPSIARFAQSIDVAESTIYEWLKQTNDDGTLTYPEFSKVFTRAREAIGVFWIEMSVGGAVPNGVAIMGLKNISGWTDKTEVETKEVGGHFSAKEIEERDLAFEKFRITRELENEARLAKRKKELEGKK
jgi:transposase